MAALDLCKTCREPTLGLSIAAVLTFCVGMASRRELLRLVRLIGGGEEERDVRRQPPKLATGGVEWVQDVLATLSDIV